MTVEDKVAVVTGVSKGIGRHTALALAAAGADVAISKRSSELLKSLANEIKKTGGKAFVFTGDMSKEKNSFTNGGGYAATKHAVLAFSRCLMLEERKNSIRVLAICPGSVDTHFFRDQQGLEENKMRPNLEKILKPEDIADTILHMILMPQRAMISEVDIRPSYP